MDAVKLLGSLLGSNATGGNMLGSLLGGGGGGQGGGGGGLGALAGLLGGGGGGGAGGLGALAGLLGGAAGGGGAGGLGGLLGSLAGGGTTEQAQPQDHDQATLLIRAMCNAAKADGSVDRDEVENIVSRLGEVDQAEADFLRQELEAPLDLEGFVRSVPRELNEQVYAFSLMGMKLDTKQEAQYLGAVARGLGMKPDQCNQIHAKLGAPEIFA